MQSRNPFPTLPQAAVLLLADFFLQYFIGAAFYDARQLLGLSVEQLQAMVMLLSNGLVLAWCTHHQGLTYRELLHSSSSSVPVTALLLVPPVLMLVPVVLLADSLLISAIEFVLPMSQWEQQAFSRMVAGNLSAIIATCVLAPVLEEMLFRGILLRAFLAQFPRWAAISWSALFFGIAHMNIYQFALAFLLGLPLGWLYERSRSLIPCIALHAAINVCVFFSSASGSAEGKPSDIEDISMATWLVALAAGAIGTYLLRRFLVANSGVTRSRPEN